MRRKGLIKKAQKREELGKGGEFCFSLVYFTIVV
jgi:hypothetical protein